jgi:hypothetical protein
LMDAGEATGSADIGVNNALELVVAAGGDNVGETVEGRAEAPCDPGPSGGSVSMDDFLLRPRPGPVPFLTFSDAAGDEVIFIISICYPVGHFGIEFGADIGVSVF